MQINENRHSKVGASSFGKSLVRLACLTTILWATPLLAERYIAHSLDEVYSLGSAAALSVHVPVGHLEIRGGDGDGVHATLELSCDNQRKRKCIRAAEAVGLVVERKRKWLKIKIDRWPRLSSQQPSVHLVLEVPKALQVELDVGVGEIGVEGLVSQLEIDLGVGEIEVDLDLDSIARVELDSGVGEASVSLPEGTVDGKGFVGSSVNWTGGKGTATVEIDVGVGEIRVKIE